MKCKLCQLNETEEDSHIIPAFAFRWMKKKSPTPYFRRPTEPNQRIQDGIKHQLLCPSCEDLLNKWETPFSNQIFKPIYIEDNSAHCFTYDEWFLKFATSISWRTLTCLVQEYPDKELHKKTDPALHAWENYLLGKSNDIAPFDQHVLIIDEIVNTINDPLTSEINTYLKAGITFDTVHGERNAYIFSKICSVLIIGVIYETDPIWEGTKILKKGEHGPGNFTVPDHLSSFLNAGVDMMLQSRNGISDKQSEIIGKSMKK